MSWSHGRKAGLSFLYDLLWLHRRRIGGLFAILFLSAVLKLPIPFLTIYLVDHVLPTRDFGRLVSLSLVLLAMSGLFIGIEFLRNYYGFLVSRRLYATIQVRLLNHVEKLPLSYFNGKGTGYIMSRFLDDGGMVNGWITDTLVPLSQHLLTFLIGILAIFYINWKLAAASVIVLPFFVVSNTFQGARLRALNHEVQEQKARRSWNLQEILAGIAVIKAYGREKWASIWFFNNLKTAIRAERYALIKSAMMTMVVSFLSSLGPLIVLCFGGYEVMVKQLTLGELLGFNSVLGYLYGPSQAIAASYVNTQKSLAALERLVEVLELSKEPGLKAPRPAFLGLLPRHYDICFDHVSFSYDSGQMAVRDVTFTIPESATVAIAGHSGAGKSTLLSLLLRLYEPCNGAIRIGGFDIRSIDVKLLRNQIAVVSQDTFLFNTTVRENISLGRRDASYPDIVDAARLANAHDFIQAFPDGYETRVGTMGHQLSSGQRQRIALARAVLSDCKVLILDEATSSVDSQSEELIASALKDFAPGRTTLLVSHRLSSVIHAEMTVWLDAGRVVAVGRHQDLMKHQGYCGLYGEQFALTAERS